MMILPAKNFNEQEFLSVKSIIESSGIKLFIASDANGLCVGENGLKVKADIQLYNVHESNFRGIVFIGGKGVVDFWENTLLHKIIHKFYESLKPVAAICGAPVILAKSGILNNIDATCYPDAKKDFEKYGVNFIDQDVVIGKQIITAKGPVNAIDFARAFAQKIN
ncbi:MAG: DJ-1/PfpI family protein [Melioribacteraceae bacterium]|nr:DJ-1/PfpI family protein [Melioribacteraceae bacterium]MCF8354880.1 DJ-1/PfpI family protein [Melioribacteraceae bacterium]MCF8393898.1 DJ-1/PfpI family protein [Melioribacteraceae bacterium]